MMKRDYATLLFKAGLAILVLAALTFLFALVVPSLIGQGQVSDLIKSYVPYGALLLALLAAFLGEVGTLILAYEVATARNENLWKMLWLMVLLLLGFGVGVAIYYAVARKERR